MCEISARTKSSPQFLCYSIENGYGVRRDASGTPYCAAPLAIASSFVHVIIIRPDRPCIRRRNHSCRHR